MAETIHERIERERKAANPQAQFLRDFRNYARGRQRSTLQRMQQSILRGVTGKVFCDNVCKMILQAACQRLQLARYQVDDTAVLQWLTEFWTLTNLPTLSDQVHWATLRDGNHAVALAWDNEKQRVQLARERWWDGKTGIFISYDDQDNPLYAVKEWKTTEGKLRRVVWWPDRIERYVAEAAGWRPYSPDDNTPWQEKWVGKDGKPLGLPVVHFRNSYMPNDSSDDETDSFYGVSEFDGGIIGLQDEVNDIQRDITSAARYTGYQMLWGAGVTTKKDANGDAIPLTVEPGAFFQSDNPAARYGTLPAGDLAQLERALLIKLRAISRMTATPLHQITGGDWPSGEALLQADMPLVAKVESMGDAIGPSWGSVAHKATLLANAFGNAGLDTEKMITAVFASPVWTNDLTKAQVANAIATHVSNQEVLRTLGKSPEQIKTIMDEKAKEAKDNVKRAQEMGLQPDANNQTNNNQQPNQGNNPQNNNNQQEGQQNAKPTTAQA